VQWHRRDASLEGGIPSGRRPRRIAQVKHAARDQGFVPPGAILFLEAKEVALVIHAGGDARGVQEHQGQQTRALRVDCRQDFPRAIPSGEWLPANFFSRTSFFAAEAL